MLWIKRLCEEGNTFAVQSSLLAVLRRACRASFSAAAEATASDADCAASSACFLAYAIASYCNTTVRCKNGRADQENSLSLADESNVMID
jgi:hypothetical protein